MKDEQNIDTPNNIDNISNIKSNKEFKSFKKINKIKQPTISDTSPIKHVMYFDEFIKPSEDSTNDSD